jgi:hypothetical protein
MLDNIREMPEFKALAGRTGRKIQSGKRKSPESACPRRDINVTGVVGNYSRF